AHRPGLGKQRSRRRISWRITSRVPPRLPSLLFHDGLLRRGLRGGAARLPVLCLPLLLPLSVHLSRLPAPLSRTPRPSTRRLLCRGLVPPRGCRRDTRLPMDLDTNRTATAPRSTNPVGRAIQVPLAPLLRRPRRPTRRRDRRAVGRRKNKMAEQPLSG